MGNSSPEPAGRTTGSYLVTSQSMGSRKATVQAYSWGGIHVLLEERGTRCWRPGVGIMPDMTDLVLSDPDLVRKVLSADQEAREGRFLSWDEVFGE